MRKSYESIIRDLDNLLNSQQAAMLPDHIFGDLKKICQATREAAATGDLDEAERLLGSAGIMLKEEANFSGFE